MAERNTGKRRPGGFTLVEMLVVITIIAILAAIIIPVGLGALNTAKRASTGVEISDIMTGITRYVSDNGGEYPPSFGEAQAAGVTYADIFNGKVTGVTWQNTVLGRYVRKAYPKCSSRDIQYLFTMVADNLDQCSALPFWLNQTSADVKYPFTGPNKRSYFTMEEARLTQFGVIQSPPNAVPAIQPLPLYGFRARNDGESMYIYIEARHYRFHVNDDLSSNQTAKPVRPAAGTDFNSRLPEFSVRPWLRRAVVDANPLNPNNYVNGESYQLHCAGLDTRFSTDHSLLRKFPCGDTGLDYFGNQIPAAMFTDDKDNQTNFSDGNMISSVPAQ